MMEYIIELVKQWAGIMGISDLIIGVGFKTYQKCCQKLSFFKKIPNIPYWLFVAIAVILFFLAGYGVWQDKDNKVKELLEQLNTKKASTKMINKLLDFLGEAGNIQARCIANPNGNKGWSEYEIWSKEIHDYIIKEKQLGPSWENFLERSDDIRISPDIKAIGKTLSKENEGALLSLYQRKVRLDELIKLKSPKP